MPTETSVATSPAPAAPAAQKSDAKAGPGNLSMAAASAQMFARQVEAAKKPATPPPTATAETAPANAETTPDASVAEAAKAASSETPAGVTETPQSEAAETGDDGQGATEAEAGGDDVLSPKSSLDEYHKALVQKRIDKERAKRGVLEAQMKERDTKIAALEAQVQMRQRNEPQAPEQETSQQAPRTVQVPANIPLAEVNDQASLADLRKQAKEAIRFVEDTLETPRAWKERTVEDPDTGAEIKVRTTKLGDQELTEDQLRAVRRQAKLTLEDHIPAREQYLSARAQTQQLAQQKFPFLKDKQSPEYQQVRQFLSNPWAQQNPHSEWIAAVYVKGLKAIESEESAARPAASTAPKAKPAPIKTSTDQSVQAASGSAARVPIGTGARQQLAASEEKVKAKHGITAEDAKQQLLNRERFRNSP